MNSIDFSILIVTFNRIEKLRKTLKEVVLQLEALKSLQGEIIVVDDGSTDGTVENLLKEFSCINFLSLPHNGAAPCRWIGIKEAKGELIIFLDDDTLPQKGWLENLLFAYQTHKTIIMGRVIHPSNIWGKLTALLEFPQFSGCKLRYLNNFAYCNLLIPRKFIRKELLYPFTVEGLDISDRVCSWRLYKEGVEILFNPSSCVMHNIDCSLINLKNREKTYGAKFIIARKVEPTLPYGRFIKLGKPSILWIAKILKGIQNLCILNKELKVNKGELPLIVYYIIYLSFSFIRGCKEALKTAYGKDFITTRD